MDRALSTKRIKKQNLKKWLKPIGILTSFTLFVFLTRWFINPSIERTQIRTAVVQQGSIKASVRAGGVVVPLVEETIISQFDSRITKLLVQPGQFLDKGTPILELEKRSVIMAIEKLKEQLALKESQIGAAKLELQKSLNDIESRQALLSVDLESRKARESRLAQLLNKGATAEQDLLEAKLGVKRTHIELQQLMQSKRDQQSTIDAKIEALNLEKSILQKELSEEQHLLAAAVVKAPRSGVLSWVKNEEGASVAENEPVAKVSDNNRFRVKASLSDFYASQLVPGMAAEIFYKDTKLIGQLATLSPTIENGVMNVFINLESSEKGVLRNNLRVDVQLITQELADVTTLSKGPFVKGSGLQHVFVIRDDMAFKTKIMLGASGRDEFQVVEGLAQGDEVIISDVADYLHLEQVQIN